MTCVQYDAPRDPDGRKWVFWDRSRDEMVRNGTKTELITGMRHVRGSLHHSVQGPAHVLVLFRNQNSALVAASGWCLGKSIDAVYPWL